MTTNLEATLGQTTYQLTEESGDIYKITRFSQGQATGVFYVPRSLLDAYARMMFIHKVSKLFEGA